MSAKSAFQTATGDSVTADTSCRWPLFALLSGAVFWLLAGSILTLIATIKFHSPDFLAEPAWLTYGRVRPAGLNAMIYGFCLPSALGLTLWLLARLGRTTLAGAIPVVFGALLWHLGVGAGVVGVLSGDATGFEHLEFPSYAAAMIAASYLVLGVAGVLTFRQRADRGLFVTQWFLLAAIFWFPWIYSTATILTSVYPVRGMAQAVVGWWFSANLILVWFGLVGLGIVFYLLPRLLDRELESHYLAMFVFWMLILFGTWTGIPKTAPVPAWIPMMSKVTTVLAGLALVGAALILHRTLGADYRLLSTDPSLMFAGFAVASFVIAGFMGIAEVLSGASSMLHLSWYATARSWLQLYGFFAMALFAGIYYVWPQLTGRPFPLPRLVRLHFWLAASGVMLAVIPLAVGGIVQDGNHANPEMAFVDVAKGTLMFLRISSIGDVLTLAGHFLLALNVLLAIGAFCWDRVRIALRTATIELQEQGVNS